MKKLLLVLLFPILGLAQINTAEYYLEPNQSIFYFNADWEKASKSEAEFYRIVTLDSNNVPIGEIKDYYKSGEIQSIIEAAILLDNNDDSNSKWQGKSQIFFESGEVMAKLYYVNGKREGKQTYYYKSGKINYTWKTINDKIEGPYKAFYESGEINEIENWNNGNKLDFTSFYKNGQIKITYKLINGKIDGLWKGFYENGNREQEVNFKNGVRVGLLRDFYENGKLNFISKWENGEKFFEETFHENGQIKASYGTSQLEDGSYIINGNYKSYNEQGKLKSDYNYNSKGKYDGQSKDFDNQGKIISVSEWNNGISVKETRFHPITERIILNIKSEGNRVFEERFPEGNKVWKWVYNEDWETEEDVEGEFIPLYYRYQFFKGKTSPEPGSEIFNVILKYKDDFPQLLYSVTYTDSDYNSIKKSKFYFDNGNIQQITSYNSVGQRDGDTDYFNEDGSFDRSVSYKNGLKDLWNYDCDDNNQNCEYSYTSYFSSKEDAKAKGWLFYDDEDELSFVPTTSDQKEANNKYYWDKKKSGGVIRYVTLPVESDDDFQFKTTVDWWNGANNQYFGIIVGWKDWENYTRLMIAPNGWHKAEIWKKGVNIGMADGKKVENGGYGQPTTLNIVKINGGTIFSIDGKPIYTSEYSSLSGDMHGFYMGGIQSALFDNVKAIRTPNSNSSEGKKAPKRNENSENWAGNGSGIILTSNGYIATNNHVIEGANDIEVEFLYKNEIRSFNARVIQTDPANDLAIIKIEDQNFYNLGQIPYKFKTNNVLVGESVFALGYPMALSVMGKEIKFTDGKISSRTGFQGDITTYQSTTPIQGGNSGGPLFDSKGNLIAINSAKLKADVADNVSYSIKSSYLLSLIDALPQEISIPNSSVLATKPLTEKIKTLSKYVVLIKVK